jgi:hypothetical protein
MKDHIDYLQELIKKVREIYGQDEVEQDSIRKLMVSRSVANSETQTGSYRQY